MILLAVDRCFPAVVDGLGLWCCPDVDKVADLFGFVALLDKCEVCWRETSDSGLSQCSRVDICVVRWKHLESVAGEKSDVNDASAALLQVKVCVCALTSQQTAVWCSRSC